MSTASTSSHFLKQKTTIFSPKTMRPTTKNLVKDIVETKIERKNQVRHFANQLDVANSNLKINFKKWQRKLLQKC